MGLLDILKRVNPLGPGIQKILSDSFTSWNGDWDPARLFGYGFAVLVSLQFIIQSAIDLWKNGHWDPVQYSLGAVGVGGMYAAVAVGVRAKANTENPVVPGDTSPTPGLQARAPHFNKTEAAAAREENQAAQDAGEGVVFPLLDQEDKPSKEKK